jgi:hypothetical protein
MLNRLRSTWLAGGGAVLLVLSMAGMSAAAVLAADTPTVVTDPAEPVVIDTSRTFEDVNGDGIDDDCAVSPVVADAPAAAAAFLLVDTDHDGTISTTEAAHSDWVGGVNCNHGGFVSWVSNGSGEETDETDETEATDAAVSPTLLTFEDVNGDGIDDDCAASAVTADPAAAAAAFLLVDTNADGKISTTEAAHSTWVGGKNCNHGGFVSWVAHNKDKASADAEAAKKDHAAKDALKAEKTAKQANKGHGKGHGKN